MLFVIEHLESELFEWCRLEYAHMASIVGKENLLITNTKADVSSFASSDERSVSQLSFEKACVLDPESEETLTPEIAKKFDVFIFGGILGDNPPRARTGVEVTSKMKYPAFNLGKEQMSTDTAVRVTKMIIDGKNLEDIEFKEGIEIETGENESVLLPYKYVVVDGKPILAPGLREMLRKQEDF